MAGVTIIVTLTGSVTAVVIRPVILKSANGILAIVMIGVHLAVTSMSSIMVTVTKIVIMTNVIRMVAIV